MSNDASPSASTMAESENVQVGIKRGAGDQLFGFQGEETSKVARTFKHAHKEVVDDDMQEGEMVCDNDETNHTSAEDETVRLRLKNSDLCATITRMEGEYRALFETHQRALKKNKDLSGDIEELKKRIDGFNELIHNVCNQINAPLPSGTAAKGREKIYLKQALNLPIQGPLTEVRRPCRFQSNGCFPHAIDLDPRTGAVHFQIEHRRTVTFSFDLSFKDGTPASEIDLSGDGMVAFKLQLLYADDLSEAHVGHFIKPYAESITCPSLDTIGTQHMLNGTVSFHIKKWNVASSENKDGNRAFIVKVLPLDDALAADKDLCFTTVPFYVRAKVTAPRATEKKTGDSKEGGSNAKAKAKAKQGAGKDGQI